MKLYLAGPMRGCHLYGLIEFTSAAYSLRHQGHAVFNPLERDMADTDDPLDPSLPLEDQDFDLRAAMVADLQFIVSDACEGIALLPGWKESEGASFEAELARICGKLRYKCSTDGRLDLINDDTPSD